MKIDNSYNLIYIRKEFRFCHNIYNSGKTFLTKFYVFEKIGTLIELDNFSQKFLIFLNEFSFKNGINSFFWKIFKIPK